MNTILRILACSLFLGVAAHAAPATPTPAASPESTPVAAPAKAGKLLRLTLDGMVCNFCATNIDKTFLKRGEVAKVHVNLNAKTVLVALKEGKSLDDATIKAVVEEAGFDLRDTKRTDEDFDKAVAALKASKKK